MKVLATIVCDVVDSNVGRRGRDKNHSPAFPSLLPLEVMPRSQGQIGKAND